MRGVSMSAKSVSPKWSLMRSGAFAALLLTTACANSGNDVPLDSLSDREIFALGESQLADRKADDAAFSFGEIERLYPYSELGARALIKQAYAYHADGNFDSSRAAARRYLDFYPREQDAAYAAYLVALSYYDQIDEIGRDQGLTLNALRALQVVIERFPESEYAQTSQQKFALAFSILAAKEMEVGRYYLRRGHYLAAANRFRTVVESFETTVHTAEALHRLVEAYLSLGLIAEAQTAAAILGYNYQGSEWYAASYDLLAARGLTAAPTGDNWLTGLYARAAAGSQT